MKEIVVVSGKGGTGKTFISSNFLYYIKTLGIDCTGIDCDVETPNLAQALGGFKNIRYRRVAMTGRRPVVDYNRCTLCRLCESACSSKAISVKEFYVEIDYEKCESCGICAILCPEKALRMIPYPIGEIVYGETLSGVEVFTGNLFVGGKNSGRLVYELRHLARIEKPHSSIFVVDAAPGIGCPVISSIAGSNIVLIVLEPTLSSIQGAIRVQEIAKNFNIDCYAIVNKYRGNGESRRVIEYIEQRFKVLGYIPFDIRAVLSYNRSRPIIKLEPQSTISKFLIEIFDKLLDILRL